jgi:hypothetical protein
MDQQFAHHDHLKIRFRHAPDLTGGQNWLANGASRLYFFHGLFCVLTFDYAS